MSSKDPPHDLPAALSKIYTSGNVNMFEECFPSSAEKPRKDAIVGEGVCIIILDMRLRQSQLVGVFPAGSENIRLDVVYGIGRGLSNAYTIPFRIQYIHYLFGCLLLLSPFSPFPYASQPHVYMQNLKCNVT